MTGISYKLINIESKIWDKLGIEAGSDFLNEDNTKNKKWGLFVWELAIRLEEQKITKLSKKIFSELENYNCHSLNQALKELKMYE